MMRSNVNPVIVGLDIGTTKIVAVAGRKTIDGKLEILGVGKASSAGVTQGMVLNIEQCTRAIDEAIENCIQLNPQIEIKEVYVGISGQHIRNTQTSGTRVRNMSDEEISVKDIELLVCEQYKTRIAHDEQIIDIIPQEYSVDDINGVLNPIGMRGSKIDCNFNLITGKTNLIHNIERCISKSYLKSQKMLLHSLASAKAVTNEEDIEAGVMVLDIGGGTTDLAIYNKGILKYNCVIPIGGANITASISDGLGILKSQAEFLKLQHRTTILEPENEFQITTVPNLRGLPPKEISIKKLANIIQSSMKEILDYAMYIVKQKSFDKNLHGGIIITGGTSQIKGMMDFAESYTGMSVRIGYIYENLTPQSVELCANPEYASAVGLILEGHEHYESIIKPYIPETNPIQQLIEESIIKVAITDTIEVLPKKQDIEAYQPKSQKVNKNFINNLKYKFMGLFEAVEDEVLV